MHFKIMHEQWMLKTSFPILDMSQNYHVLDILSDYNYYVGDKILQSWFCIHLNYQEILIQRRHIFCKWHFRFGYSIHSWKKWAFVTPSTLVLFKFKIVLLDLCPLNIYSLIKIIIDLLLDVGSLIPIFYIIGLYVSLIVVTNHSGTYI